MEPLTSLETLCRIIIRAREYEAQVPGNYDEGEDADNVDGDDGESYSTLIDGINTSVEEELQGVLEDLAEDQIAEVLAFCWVGQGTYDASDWDEAQSEASDFGDPDAIVEELMEMPMFASMLESGMAAFELNCDGIGDLT